MSAGIITAPGVPYAASQFILGQPLPPTARPDLAFMRVVSLSAPTPDDGETFGYIVPAPYIDVVVYARALLTTNNNVRNRPVAINAYDGSQASPQNIKYAQGNQLYRLFSTLEAPASVFYTYIASAALATTADVSFTGNSTGQLPAPLIPIPTSGSFFFDNTNPSGADTWSNGTATVLRIPTGPQMTVQTVGVTATPLLA